MSKVIHYIRRLCIYTIYTAYFSGLCLRPEHLPSFRNITTFSILILWIKNTEPLTILYMWTAGLPTRAQSSVCCGSWVFLSEVCLPVTHWAAGSSTLRPRARGGGGRVCELESQRGRVNAVAFSCGFWSIIKQVSQVSSTLKHNGKDWYAHVLHYQHVHLWPSLLF